MDFLKKNKIYVLGALVVLISILGISYFLIGTSALASEDYIVFSYDGVNTKGKITYSIDEELLVADYTEKYKTKNFVETMDAVYPIVKGITVEFDKEKELSNGDQILAKVNVTVGDDKVKSSEVKLVITDLKDAIEISKDEIIQNIIVDFSGTSGNGNVQVTNLLKSPLDKLVFIVNEEIIKNGDEITLRLEDEEVLFNLGYMITEMPSYIVSGLDEVAEDITLVSNFSEIERIMTEKVKKIYPEPGEESTSTYFDNIFEYERNLIGSYYLEFADNSTFEQDGTYVQIYDMNRVKGPGAGSTNTVVIVGFKGLYLGENGEAEFIPSNIYYREYLLESAQTKVTELRSLGYNESEK